MSFLEYKERISEGDTVIIFLGHNQMQSVLVTQGKVHQTKYGALPHSDMIGRTFGTKMYSVNKRGWVYLLHPTPELWTVNLPHRTQILYTTDISMVLLQLDIKPGSVVVESGTGSGSMSHSLIRSLAPTGHLYTFEFHQQRADKAKLEFQQHKISELVTVECRDVCKDGFGLDHVADADLPSPWDAIVSAKQALKTNGSRICSFSPCIEQVQKSCDVLRSHGFRDVKVMECLLRTFDVKTVPLTTPNFGPTDPMEFTIQEECAGVKAQIQSSSNDSANETSAVPEITAGSSCTAASLMESEMSETTSAVPDITAGSSCTAASLKESIMSETTSALPEITAGSSCTAASLMESEMPDITAGSSRTAASLMESEMSETTSAVPDITAGSSCTAASLIDTDPESGLMRNTRTLASQKADKCNVLTAKPSKQMPGHTGYLTFATLYAPFLKVDTHEGTSAGDLSQEQIPACE